MVEIYEDKPSLVYCPAARNSVFGQILLRQILLLLLSLPLSLNANISVIEQWRLLPPLVSSSPYHCTKEKVEVDEQLVGLYKSVRLQRGGQVVIVATTEKEITEKEMICCSFRPFQTTEH